METLETRHFIQLSISFFTGAGFVAAMAILGTWHPNPWVFIGALAGAGLLASILIPII